MTAKWQYKQAYEAAVEEVRSLKAENEKLKKMLVQYGLFREIVGDPATEFANLRHDLHALERENIKLRELVRDMWANGMCDCDEFGVCAKCEYHCSECEYHYPDRMRELGIEAN